MDTPNSKPSSASTTTTTTTTTTTNNNNNSNKLINLHSSDSSAVQESPVFNFISNLSPIQPVKAAPVAQGFPGLASPPLVFRSPRNSLLSVLDRQLRSSAFTTEVSQDNDKGQKTHENPGGSANRDLGLQSQVSNNQKGCNTKKSGQVVHCSPSGCFDEFLPDPMGCSDPLHKKQSGDVPQSSEVGCLEKKDNGTDEDIVPDGSTLLKVTERAKAKSKISIKVVKNAPKRLTSVSSECPGILTKLPIGHISELFKIGDSFSEASHFERSLRRCLFDENERENSADGSGFWNPNENLSRIQEVANLSSSGTPGNSQMINLPKPITSMSVSPITGNHPVSISKPLGIGLHLNSVVYPGTKDSIIGGQQASEKVVRVEGKNSVFVMSNQPVGNVCESSVPTNLIDKFPATSEEIYKSKPCSVATSSRTCNSDAVELFNNPIVLKPDHPSATVYNKRKLNSELAESNEEFNQASPKKKRKKCSGTSDDDTVKRCNCKMSKCLKLYCDCFAAGFYCGESCSCQGCFNRPEFEDTVLETRQQIESRNPLAFAPKVVQPVTDSPASSKEVENLSTPSSARHKRGCNCKKSMCLKKYCECYQSNVGCSDNCRCEGCKNVYGIREDFSIAREFMIKVTEATPKVILDEKKEISTVRGNIVNSRVHNSPNVTPVTPALQCSDQRKNALKSRLAFSRCLQSPDSSHDILLSDENFTSPISSPSHRMLEDEPLDPEKGCENSDRLLSPCERPANASDLVSTVASSSSKTRDLFHVSRPETFARSSLPPSSTHPRWRSSPVMPFTQSVGSEYLPNYDSGSKDSDVLGDDTPEILKDSATPTESVKVRSPNKKRISPPHNRVDSPESLRHSRKFVLQAVCSGLDHHNLPKFPTVSSFSQNSGNGKRNESLDP